LNINI
jgi:hypothetical protein